VKGGIDPTGIKLLYLWHILHRTKQEVRARLAGEMRHCRLPNCRWLTFHGKNSSNQSAAALSTAELLAIFLRHRHSRPQARWICRGSASQLWQFARRWCSHMPSFLPGIPELGPGQVCFCSAGGDENGPCGILFGELKPHRVDLLPVRLRQYLRRSAWRAISA